MANEAADEGGMCDGCHEIFHKSELFKDQELRVCERCLNELDEIRNRVSNEQPSLFTPFAEIMRDAYPPKLKQEYGVTKISEAADICASRTHDDNGEPLCNENEH